MIRIIEDDGWRFHSQQVATADTFDEMGQFMEEGIIFQMEGLREDGLSITEPTIVVTYAEVA